MTCPTVRIVRGLVALGFIVALASPLRAQQADSAPPPPDSGRVHELDAVVVTAERARAPLASSTNAVSVIDRAELRRRPLRTLADALQQAPGVTFVDFDGTGLDE